MLYATLAYRYINGNVLLLSMVVSGDCLKGIFTSPIPLQRCSQGLGPNDILRAATQRLAGIPLVSAGHIILTPTQPVGARTVLGCDSNPRPLGHGSKPLPTELSRPLSLETHQTRDTGTK
ncbi:hypothetical protein ElyMa_000880700 [Elysia marginata]|uniref:Uncharacterized protein n=1 Tax=Elysia marginata TaxID=1093978 RepID=A0AAV4H443_9GAST|nr:hypothetical protein ElyMa_000880700 [Elysia marginata]